ncbi:hypothetical protein FVE89_09245 [Methylobacterium sp. 2A]|jgi:hypothetical protein|uniref:hypothetical protein n=1 Tax=Methylobacterium sp. 2A TaxID=2603816 RepID=UPI00135464CA|nr:hypothetical protein [Methylobacterium sp. 2A]MWV22180.1 hypothetical protein [Methylobacterium sp. 2A]
MPQIARIKNHELYFCLIFKYQYSRSHFDDGAAADLMRKPNISKYASGDGRDIYSGAPIRDDIVLARMEG